MSRRKARMEQRIIRTGVVRAAVIGVLVLMGLGLIYQLGLRTQSAITRFTRDIRPVEYGSVEDKLSGHGVLITQEEVINADYSGRFENMVKEREKISKGTLLGYFVTSQGQTPLKSARAGIFMRNTDGLEAVFSQYDFQSMSPEIFKYKTIQTGENQLIQPSQPIYKIVNNLEPTRLVVCFPQEEVKFTIRIGQPVKILQGGKEIGSAVIVEMKQDFGELWLLIKFNSFQEQLLGQRYINLEVLFNTDNGFVIPAKALVENDGKKGIFCSNGEDITFKPVKVIRTKDDIVIVEGLSKNDLIIINPPH